MIVSTVFHLSIELLLLIESGLKATNMAKAGIIEYPVQRQTASKSGLQSFWISAAFHSDLFKKGQLADNYRSNMAGQRTCVPT